MSSWFRIAVLVVCLAVVRAAPDPAPAPKSELEPAVGANKPVDVVSVDGPTMSRNELNDTLNVRDVNSNATVNDSVSNNVQLTRGKMEPETAQNKARKTVARDDSATCYECDSTTDPKKCRDLSTMTVRSCDKDQHVCHYIVGEVIQNNREKETIILLGCDKAPAYKLSQIPTPVRHTASDSETDCKDFTFTHQDAGGQPAGSVYANLDISFKGYSCVCNGFKDSKCNVEALSAFQKSGDSEIIVRPYTTPASPTNNNNEPAGFYGTASQSTLSVTIVAAVLSWTILARVF